MLYVGQTTKRFLLDNDSKPTHIKLNCLKLYEPVCSGYIKNTPDHLDPDVTVFLIHVIIAIISYVSYVINSGKWFFKNYYQIEKFFQLVKKID